ncbi:MAG: hypothetical protein ACO3A4_03530 [Silvanigrellaceae bacterium]
MRRYQAAILLCTSFSSVSRADLKSWSLTPEVETVGSVSDRVLWNLRPGLGFKWKDSLWKSDEFSFDAQARFRSDTQADFVSTQSRYEFKTEAAYLQWQGNRASAALGWQKYTWGDSAFFDGVDFLNPRDLSEPLYADDDSIKIPVPSANFQYLGNNTIFQTVVTFKSERTPVAKDYNGIPIRAPGERVWLSDVEVGGKAGGLLKSGWDLNGYILSHLERVPQFVLVPKSLTDFELQLHEPRVFTLGLTATQSIGDFVFRGEFAHHANRAVPDQGATERGLASQAVFHGTMDATVSKNTLVTFELWSEWWSEKSSERFRGESTLIGVRLQRPFWDGRLEPSAGYLSAPDGAESWGFAKIDIKIFESSRIGVEGHWAKTSTGRVLARRGLKNLIRSTASWQF